MSYSASKTGSGSIGGVGIPNTQRVYALAQAGYKDLVHPLTSWHKVLHSLAVYYGVVSNLL